MSSSNSPASSMPHWKRVCFIVLWVSAAALSSAAYADDDRNRGHAKKHRGHDHSWAQDRERDHWRDHRRHERGRDRDHRSDSQRGYRGRDWRFHRDRYWAPPQYRGRHCTDRRHYHGVHYHVAAHDYYDYYYPRFRYYGPRPLGANASVIITLPLF
ncbi:MAG: hypothetical protein ACREV5_20320 [Steroidobacter sp.]